MFSQDPLTNEFNSGRVAPAAGVAAEGAPLDVDHLLRRQEQHGCAAGLPPRCNRGSMPVRSRVRAKAYHSGIWSAASPTLSGEPWNHWPPERSRSQQVSTGQPRALEVQAVSVVTVDQIAPRLHVTT